MALDLFNASTMEAVKSGLSVGALEGESLRAVQRAEERIKQRLPIQGHMAVRRLVDDLKGLGEAEADVYRALLTLVNAGTLQFLSERKIVKRLAA